MSGTPPTVVALTTGTIWSPWPPSTIAVTSFTDAPVSHAMNVEKRAVSRIPAIPNTRSFGHVDTLFATWHIASSGFETTIRIASGRDGDHLLGHGLDDLLVRRHEIVAPHPGRARQPGGDHDDRGACALLVAVRADDRRLEAEHGAHLVDVERLALRQALLDVDEDDVRVVALREHLRARGTDVPGPHDGHLLSHLLAPPSRGRTVSIQSAPMSATTDFRPGLEGVVAVETEIAEPDREGGQLRYRGIDIEELVGTYPYEFVWGLLVDNDLSSKMPDPEPYEPAGLTGNAPADLQAETARLAGAWKLGKLSEISDEQARKDLGRLSAQMMEIVARSAAVADGREPASDDVVAKGKTAAEKFLLRWRGEADPKHVKAIDTYWICTAEHGLNASTFTARVVASTGADCRRSALVGGRRALRPAARRRACVREADARGGCEARGTRSAG